MSYLRLHKLKQRVEAVREAATEDRKALLTRAYTILEGTMSTDKEGGDPFDYAQARHASRVAVGLDPAAPKQVFPEDKGLFGGRCNRGSCLKPGATWWNRSTQAYYCGKCARLLNEDPFNKRDAEKMYQGPLCIEHKEHGVPK